VTNSYLFFCQCVEFVEINPLVNIMGFIRAMDAVGFSREQIAEQSSMCASTIMYVGWTRTVEMNARLADWLNASRQA